MEAHFPGAPMGHSSSGLLTFSITEFDRPPASFEPRTSVKYRDEKRLGASPKLGSFSISSGFRAAYCRRVCRYPRLGMPISPSGPLPLVRSDVHDTGDGRVGSEVLLDEHRKAFWTAARRWTMRAIETGLLSVDCLKGIQASVHAAGEAFWSEREIGSSVG